MTNGDKIRNMANQEIAESIMNIAMQDVCLNKNWLIGSCYTCNLGTLCNAESEEDVLEWLKQEVNE